MTIRKHCSAVCPICKQIATYPGEGIDIVKTKRGSWQTYHRECIEHERRVNNERRN